MTFIALVAATSGNHVSPTKPSLIYTSDKQFTIQNYDPSATYTLTNCTRSGSLVTVTTAATNAVVSASYPKGVAPTITTLYTAVNARVLDAIQQNLGGVLCGTTPWSTQYCSNNWILDTNGNTSVSGGTAHGTNYGGTAADCGNQCDNCYTLYASCYSWHWTDYSSSGYTLKGNTWGKTI
jgi:hypothetical protein